MTARVLVAAIAVLACVGICAADAPAGFIRAQDSRFVDANCNEFNFVGANTCVPADATGGPLPDRKTSVGGSVLNYPLCRSCDSMQGRRRCRRRWFASQVCCLKLSDRGAPPPPSFVSRRSDSPGLCSDAFTGLLCLCSSTLQHGQRLSLQMPVLQVWVLLPASAPGRV